MEWLLIAGLGVWVWLQGRRIGTLTRKLAELERLFGERAATSAPQPAAPPAPAQEPLLLDTPLPPEEPLLLDTPLPPDALEPLLLDTPVPEASNDIETPAPAAAKPAIPHVFMPRAEDAPAKRAWRFEQWLAENGLAWLGGAAFALGAIYLVAVAAQQNWFTPLVQLGLASVLGIALLAASEWARRISIAKPPGHPLVAALLAGAGVLTFYVSVWAAHGPFRYIDDSTAIALLVACAALLIALSYLHGQALGVLAIAAALLAPALTDAREWPNWAFIVYVSAVGAAGFALAALRRWAWVAAATVAGLYFWFAAALADDQIRHALALLSFASLGGIALAFRPPLAEEAQGRLTWRRAHTYLPAIAISVSSVLLIWIWLASSPAPTGLVAGPAWVGAMFVALAAAAVRQRAAPPATFVVAVAALVAGFMGYLRSRHFFGPLGADFYPFVLFASVVVMASAIGAKPHRSGRLLIAGAGAIGAALLAVLAAFSRDQWHTVQAWAPLFVSAALLFGCAWFAGRETPDPEHDRAISFWAGAAAVLTLIGIESAFPAEARSPAHAGAALMFAGGVAWRGWASLRFAALTAAAVSIGHALSPSLIGAVMSGAIPLWGGLTVLAATAGLLFGAAYFAQRAEHKATADSLGSAAIIALLIGAFLALRWIAVGGAPTPRLDALSEHALGALILLAAGHIVMARLGQELGLISRWRGHVLFGLGLLYAIGFVALVLNPWWGAPLTVAAGPPLLDNILLAYAAPAALAFAAAYRLYDHQRLFARIYAAAGGVLALTWALVETRRLFHAEAMHAAPVGLFEGACYGLIFLGGALGVAIAARLRLARHPDGPFSSDLARITRGSVWFGVIIAAMLLLIARHPWWGSQDADASTTLSAGLAVLAQLAAVGLALALGRVLSVSRPLDHARFAAASAAMLFGWSFGHALIRFVYHGGGMDGGAAMIGLEGFAHSLWPLGFVLLASIGVVRAPHRDSIRHYIYDLQAISATAVWPALAFAGLGLWLIFNPWWGIAPAQPISVLTAVVAPATPIFAAWLSKQAARVPHVRAPEWFDHAAMIACIAHLFVALTLLVRWLFHRADMSNAPVGGLEMWIYSAAWALFGAGVYALGTQRDSSLLRRAGLAILVATTVKVALFDTARLDGLIRAVSLLGLAVVLVLVAWFARTYRPKPKPGDLLAIKPSARRERRHGRRQRTP